jgi:hypothetical protein
MRHPGDPRTAIVTIEGGCDAAEVEQAGEWWSSIMYDICTHHRQIAVMHFKESMSQDSNAALGGYQACCFVIFYSHLILGSTACKLHQKQFV